ncbi:CRISPR-associated protein Csc3 [Aetokthonos hydrillicola Thurmond2011]|jgi:CRISPR-associated protein Csc3|uniref:CRISPR-associated protein Csc3 n=2 Tax=Aetokthonos TaxID=1550243 RepID=A0AAP5I847_9CYAN|nr:CRISPR-associated protein Csc3 [Aetokthonos hydrillicola]MBW4587209.1 CRISPR-associated protein Csc3 [Aetokthonos hydrillicola CCALA 1050]MDR9896768.1 CRISPR-associated protein Csc3 [Aetokthonos hydrillicola Thurmond2011]
MSKRTRLLNSPPKTLEERYFSEIRPLLYERLRTHHQYGVRKGTTLAEHLDSACQFMLTVSQIAGVPEDKRPVLLAATAVHDLNKLDPLERNVKTLARDKEFLRQQFELAGVLSFLSGEEDFELARRLIERHSGHNVTDGARFLPEDPAIERWAAMITAADLFDLGIPDTERFRKVETKLTVAFNRPSNLFRVRLSEDKGYITALLLGGCEEVLKKYKLTPLAIFPDGELFEGQAIPKVDLTTEIAAVWQRKIDEVFGNNVERLVRATKDGIKINHQAIQQNIEEVLVNVEALLEKKKAGYKSDKVAKDISKWGDAAGTDAVKNADALGLTPVSNAEEFSIAEGLKAAYLSYREVGLNPKNVWDKIAAQVGISEQQRTVLEVFNGQYGRPLFAAKAAVKGIEGIREALRESFQLRKETTEISQAMEASEEMIIAASRMLNLPIHSRLDGLKELNAYIDANPKQRCSLGSTSSDIDDLISDNMPPGTKVQAFSNRLPGGISAEPKRQADSIAALAYQLMTVGANFPAVKKQDPLYLHFALPKGSSPELLKLWREHLERLAATNAEGGTVTVDELPLYKENSLNFKANKVVGFAFPKRPDFIHTTVVLPIVWGDANASLALLKSLRLALELSLSLEFGFPFTLSGNLEVELSTDIYGRVEGIPAALQTLLGNGQYNRQDAEKILERLRCIGQLATSVASIQKADDCLYDLARACVRPIQLYYVLLRWTLREQDDANLSVIWSRICQPLNTLLENLMPDENSLLTQFLKEAAQVAAEGKIWGSSFKRTAQAEPFTAFIAAIRAQKPHLGLDVIFAALIQQYHTRLDRIREHGVGQTKYEQIKRYYEVLRKLYDEVYQARPERFLADQKTLEAAYLFFLEEARHQMKSKTENDSAEVSTSV